jgi:hypothetical protein
LQESDRRPRPTAHRPYDLCLVLNSCWPRSY